MAAWYVSSVAYTAVSQFAASHVYSSGDIVRQRGNSASQTITTLTSITTTATATVTGHGFISGQSVRVSGATQTNYNVQATITVVDANTFTYTIVATTSPATGSPVVLDAVAAGNERCFRCSTAGTSAASEPAWTLTKAATTTSNTAIFTECTGNSSHQRDNGATTTWTAPAARIYPIIVTGTPFSAAGDSIYVSSDHAETSSANTTLAAAAGAFAQTIILSVTKAGSVPPVAADITSGASIACTGATALTFTGGGTYWQGITFSTGSGSSLASLAFSSSGSQYFNNCAFILNTTNSGAPINIGTSSRLVWNNCTVTFGHASQNIGSQGRFEWYNTTSAILGTTPTTLFGSTANFSYIHCHGVDLSALGSGKNLCDGSSPGLGTVILSFCKLGSSVTVRQNTPTQPCSDLVTLTNCDSGNTGYRNEWYSATGAITPEITITRTNGATDGVQKVSHKYVSNANTTLSDPLEGPPIYKWNTVTSSQTATIEFISSASLNNNDIFVELEYLGTASFPQSIFVNNTIATILTAAAAQTSSSVAWDSSPATPVKQKLVVTFTAQIAGLVRAVVKVAKASTTVYVDPLLTIA